MLCLTSDGATFLVPDHVANQCTTLSLASAAGDGPVPVPNASAADLARVVEFYVGTATSEETFFDDMSRRALFALMEAANFLGAAELLEDACGHVADLVRGRTPEQIRELFMLPLDETTEESRQAAAEYAWALG